MTDSKYRTTATDEMNGWLHERFILVIQHKATSPSRSSTIREVLAYLHEMRTLAGWRRKLAGKFRLEDETEDVEQIIAASIGDFLFNVERQKVERMDGKYIQQLWNIANLGVKTYQEGPERTGLSEFTGIARRKKLIARARVELTHELSREPSNEEIKTHINNHMLATRKNAVKQGVLIRDSDFEAGVIFSGDREVFDDGEVTVRDTIADTTTDGDFLHIEVNEAMSALVHHMREQYPSDPFVVPCTVEWARCVLSGEEPTPTVVNREVNCGYRAAEESISRLLSELPRFAVTFDH